MVTRPPRTRSVFCTERSRPDAYAALILWYLFKCYKNSMGEGAVALHDDGVRHEYAALSVGGGQDLVERFKP